MSISLELMAHESDTSLLVLQGLRLKGRTRPDVIAELYDLDRAAVDVTLAGQVDDGLVQVRDGVPPVWTLTPEGKVEGEYRLAAELDSVGGRDAFTRAYVRFRELNTEMLRVCTRWQVREIDGEQIINDHTDTDYDQAVIADLAALDAGVQPILAELVGALDRFGIYAERFELALTQVHAGEYQWFTRPIMDSYHTVWFELHEDFFATLGIDRASERY